MEGGLLRVRRCVRRRGARVGVVAWCVLGRRRGAWCVVRWCVRRRGARAGVVAWCVVRGALVCVLGGGGRGVGCRLCTRARASSQAPPACPMRRHTCWRRSRDHSASHTASLAASTLLPLLAGPPSAATTASAISGACRSDLRRCAAVRGGACVRARVHGRGGCALLLGRGRHAGGHTQQAATGGHRARTRPRTPTSNPGATCTARPPPPKKTTPRAPHGPATTPPRRAARPRHAPADAEAGGRVHQVCGGAKRRQGLAAHRQRAPHGDVGPLGLVHLSRTRVNSGASDAQATGK
jgi:hypothetical protein